MKNNILDDLSEPKIKNDILRYTSAFCVFVCFVLCMSMVIVQFLCYTGRIKLINLGLYVFHNRGHYGFQIQEPDPSFNFAHLLIGGAAWFGFVFLKMLSKKD